MNRQILMAKKGNGKLYLMFLVLLTLLVMSATGTAANKAKVIPQKFITDATKAKVAIESALQGRVVEVLKYSGQVKGEKPKVIFVVDRNGKITKEVIESTYDQEGRLISLRNMDESKDRYASKPPHAVALDPVDCRKTCWKKCGDIFCYTYCWYICIMM